MKAQVTLRSGDDQETIPASPHPPEVGTTVTHKGRTWLVVAYEYTPSHRIAPFEMIISRGGS
jgi:hypothetical protein